MTPEDLLGELSIRIYEPPLSDMREDGRICNAADPVAVLMLILDCDTEVAMNGIDNFIGNSSGRYMRETITALQTIGAQSQAALL
ncbi:DMP19 family protein [Gimesia chilikensis]|uniref:DMP19 family protein n=1 Tax=Gimesia chilikensis TaxID=2605989 RepID=UPI003A91258D